MYPARELRAGYNINVYLISDLILLLKNIFMISVLLHLFRFCGILVNVLCALEDVYFANIG